MSKTTWTTEITSCEIVYRTVERLRDENGKILVESFRLAKNHTINVLAMPEAASIRGGILGLVNAHQKALEEQ